MRLFRQRGRGEWGEVVERVKRALQEWVREGGGTAALLGGGRLPQTLAAPRAVLPSAAPGHRPGLSAVAECRDGILQYLPDEPWVGDSLGWYGEYLQPQLDLLGRLIRPGATVMEVGAGVGAHALFLAAAVGEAGHLFLYESRPVVRRILQQNLAANRVVNMTLMRRTLGGSSTGTDIGEGHNDGMRPEPSTETLDELQLERLDWLKLADSDTALAVLEGGADTLWRLRPLLFVAAADEPGLRRLAARVQEFSYRCWRLQSALFNAQNFNRRDADIFASRQAFALLAIPEEIEVDIPLHPCTEL